MLRAPSISFLDQLSLASRVALSDVSTRRCRPEPVGADRMTRRLRVKRVASGRLGELGNNVQRNAAFVKHTTRALRAAYRYKKFFNYDVHSFLLARGLVGTRDPALGDAPSHQELEHILDLLALHHDFQHIWLAVNGSHCTPNV